MTKRLRLGRRRAASVSTLRRQASEHSARGNYRQAEKCLRKALHLIEAPSRAPSPERLLLWNELGMVHKYQGKFDQAERRYRLALRHAHRFLKGPDRDFFLANIFHNLGGLDHSRRRFRRGEKYARESLRLRRKVAGPRDLAVASDMAALAALLDGQHKFAESEKLYQRALRTYHREYGQSHPEIAVILNNLAALYQQTRRPKRAEACYRRALQMKRRELGASHPDVAVTLNNLAHLYRSQGDTSAARRCFESALRILRSTLGSSHPTTRSVQKQFEKEGSRSV